MTRMFYSKSEHGFFADDVHGDNMPSDCLEITLEEHRRLINGQSEGKQIVSNENGYPVLIDFVPAPLTYAQKREREYPPMADYLDGIVKGDQAQIEAYIQACLDIKAKYPKE